jgi:hypothetical protein
MSCNLDSYVSLEDFSLVGLHLVFLVVECAKAIGSTNMTSPFRDEVVIEILSTIF